MTFGDDFLFQTMTHCRCLPMCTFRVGTTNDGLGHHEPVGAAAAQLKIMWLDGLNESSIEVTAFDRGGSPPL